MLGEDNWLYLNVARVRESAAKAFIENLAAYEGGEGNPRLAFVVQSGFPEAHHSRFVEPYLEKLAASLNSTYGGTIIKGGCEALRLQPEAFNQNLFDKLGELGVDLAHEEKFDFGQLMQLRRPERYPRVFAPQIRLVLKLQVSQSYRDYQLKKNGAYRDCNARPYKPNE